MISFIESSEEDSFIEGQRESRRISRPRGAANSTVTRECGTGGDGSVLESRFLTSNQQNTLNLWSNDGAGATAQSAVFKIEEQPSSIIRVPIRMNNYFAASEFKVADRMSQESRSQESSTGN